MKLAWDWTLPVGRSLGSLAAMTTTTEHAASARKPWDARLDFDALAPAVAKAMASLDHAATRQADQAGLEPGLHALAAWREAPFYTDQERAALALAEAVTLCAEGHVPGPVWDAAAERFSPAQLAALVGILVTISGWNRIGVATRTWLPGSYQP